MEVKKKGNIHEITFRCKVKKQEDHVLNFSQKKET